MPRQDTVDFLTAFAVGTVLGIGATLLLTPTPSPKQRVVRQLKPYRKQMRRSAEQAAEAVRGGGAATAELSGEVVRAGRELLAEFRREAAGVVDNARSELQQLAEQRVEELARGARKTRRRLRL